MDGDDLRTGTFDKGGGPGEGALGILGPVHADDDATRGGHCYGLGAAPTFAASSARRLA